MDLKRLSSPAGDTRSGTSPAAAPLVALGVESNRDASGVRWFRVTGELDAATADQFRHDRQYEGPAVIAVDGCERPVVAHLRKWRQHDDGWAWVGAATTHDDLCGLFHDRGLHLRIHLPDGRSGEADVGEFDADRVSFLGTGAAPF